VPYREHIQEIGGVFEQQWSARNVSSSSLLRAAIVAECHDNAAYFDAKSEGRRECFLRERKNIDTEQLDELVLNGFENGDRV
jgi:hypothetical protein